MNKTNIEYLTHTWNPIAMKCTPVSEACSNCWHLKRANMLAHNPKVLPEIQDAYLGVKPLLIEKRLNEPGKLKKPSIIGVQFMGDLFHEKIHRDWILQVLMVVRHCPQHTFMILTKRPQRMQHFFRYWFYNAEPIADMSLQVKPRPDNLWIGVTVEAPKYLWRVEKLLQIPAAVRFVSLEPLLSHIDLKNYLHCGLSWCIIGAESGPKKRYFNPQWAGRLISQCEKARIPVFYKQDSNQKMPKINGRIYDQYPDFTSNANE